MNVFLHGACAATCFIVGLFFLRYWTASRDRLFTFFLAGFWLLAAHWVGLALLNPAEEERHWMYLVRLAAFSAMIVGIVDKNRRSRVP